MSEIERDGLSKGAIVAAVEALLPEGRLARQLVPALLSRPPVEDIAAFEPAALAAAAQEAASALAEHRAGGWLVRVEAPDAVTAAGVPQQLVTIVNDDRAFLLDSALAEIGETMPEIRLISHPILPVQRDSSGAVTAVMPAHAAVGTPVSVIQVATDRPADPTVPERLAVRLEAILRQVAAANRDFSAMVERTRAAAAAMRERATTLPGAANRALVEEGAAFLDWLAADNFTFLGIREFDFRAGDGPALTTRADRSLGILVDPEIRVLRREIEPTATGTEVRGFLQSDTPLIVAKANARSLVHRRVYMDYIGVKEYAADGSLTGEIRLVGLFTSPTYTRSIFEIPYLRQKAQTVLDQFALTPRSHSAKALVNALETYARDEVFQMDTALLQRFVGIVMELGERPRVRVLPRVDPFDRFVSVLVFVPRERYDQRLREAIGFLLAEIYDGHVSAFYPSIPDGPLASVHFIIGRRSGPTPGVDPKMIESRIIEMSRNWMLGFEAALASAGLPSALVSVAHGLPAGYREEVAAADAVSDVVRIDRLSPERALIVDFGSRAGDPADLLRLRLYSYDRTLALSTRVPVLENLGFVVGFERTFDVRRPDGRIVHLHDMDLTRRRGGAVELGEAKARLEAAFLATFDGRIENDAFNALVLEAGLHWREANLLRAYTAYLRQTGLPFTGDYVAQTLVRHAAIGRHLVDLFAESFDPERERTSDDAAGTGADRLAAIAGARGVSARYTAITAALDGVESLDDDRILRRLLAAVLATLCTNYYAVPEVSADPRATPTAVAPALALKLDSHVFDAMPAPVPFREIFVFDARVEGVHLRFGRVARGGLRWSDRSQDYRTEVLGLVKAQQVKNAVIVPVGAKGGFYPKRLPGSGDRDAWFEAGRSAYIVFVASLLSVTDDVRGAETITPDRVVAHDGPDPYFVVAADKGTATFSDTANAVAQAHGFWLDDAFASGGSAGYDHKAMGITARGAWEAVKRHFREMDRDPQEEPFTVAGCGDMSGDVFGNGMLLSEQIRLVAAFDHRHLFLDPDPDPAVSFTERQRLFALPRSSWADYDRAKLSKGAMIVSRAEKRVTLTAEAAAAIGWDRTVGTPAEIITAILKSPVDLLFFGGIGTYVRAYAETNADAGDRANDAVRVTGRELRAKVVGEGANLGLTQAGRIEYARTGGRINTDAIDNSAGVNCSDVEVNIKIALKSAMADGQLDRPERDRLLAAMTDDVAGLVLSNNRRQTLAITLETEDAARRLAHQQRLMQRLEETGALDRTVETLPSDAAIADLKAAGRGLSRPELAVLLAYAKIDLFDRLVESRLPDDEAVTSRLFRSFPKAMRERFAPAIETHRLRREIIATRLANEIVNAQGPSFVSSISEACGASPAGVASAFLVATDGAEIAPLRDRVRGLGREVSSPGQLAALKAISLYEAQLTAWHARAGIVGEIVVSAGALRAVTGELRGKLPALASQRARELYEARRQEFIDLTLPEDLAAEIAELPLLALAPDLARVSRETGSDIATVVPIFFGITRLLGIGRLETAIAGLVPSDYYESLALARAHAQIGDARRTMTRRALEEAREPEALEAWLKDGDAALRHAGAETTRLAGTGDTSVARIMLAAGLLVDLSNR